MHITAVACGALTIVLFVFHAFMYAHNQDPLQPKLKPDLIAANLTATSTSLGTALLFLLFQTPVYGALIFLIIAMFLGGQRLFVSLADKLNPQDLRDIGSIFRLVQARTGSRALALAANSLNILTYAVLLLIEIILGASILIYAFPAYADSMHIIVAIITAGVCVYVAVGGFELVASSDRWQYWFLLTGVSIALALFLVIIAREGSSFISPLEALIKAPEGSYLILGTFVLNVIVVNLLLPMCQTASWQRLGSSESIEGLKKGYYKSIYGQLVWAWIAFALVAVYFYSAQGRQAAGPMDLFNYIDGVGLIGREFVGPLLFGALMAAIVSTADSLLIALGLGVEDFYRARNGKFPGSVSLRLTITSVFMFILVQAAFWFFTGVGESERAVIIGLMFAGVGQTILIAPIVWHAVHQSSTGKILHAPTIIISLVLGLTLLWVVSVAGIRSGDVVLNQIAPIVGLAVVLIGTVISRRSSEPRAAS